MHSLVKLVCLIPYLLSLLKKAHANGDSSNFGMSLGPNVQRYAVGDLPDVNFPLPLSWAGQIHIPYTVDDGLFFWLFEAETPSHDLIIWLNGGPGCSSLDGLTKENGPLHFHGNDSTPTPNPYSLTKLANVLYIDQPVGTGFSDGSSPAKNNAEITQDFFLWLTAFYEEFPGLTSKNTYLMGESYAGIYIPYIVQAILANRDTLNINIKSISLGDGTFGNAAALTDVAINAYMHEQNDILKIPQDLLGAFDRADQQCGFTKVLEQLKYPPQGKIIIPGNPEGNNYKRQDDCFPRDPDTPALVLESVNALCYKGCATWSTAINYLNNTIPCWNIYNIGYRCNNALSTVNFVDYFNNPAVRAAIHAPTKKFEDCNSTLLQSLLQELVQPPAYFIIPAILEQGISVHIYNGDYDFLLNHIGTELVIQNMTWCNKQGLQSPPNHKFIVDGKLAGYWGAERGLSYHRIFRAGHGVPYDQPAVALAYVRDFIIGSSGYWS